MKRQITITVNSCCSSTSCLLLRHFRKNARLRKLASDQRANRPTIIHYNLAFRALTISFFRSYSAFLNSTRLILPETVLGKSSTNSISRGVLNGAVVFLKKSCSRKGNY